MATVDSLLPRVNLYAPGVAEPLAKQFLLDAADRFCRDTWIAQEDITPVTDADGRWELASPSGYIPLAPLRVASNGYTIWTRWPNAADAAADLDLNKYTSPQPRMLTLTTEPLVASMLPLANQPQQITATIAVSVDPAVNDVPDVLISSWWEALVARALEDLLMVPNQLFTSATLSVVFAGKYREQRHKARVEVNRGMARHGARMTGPKFGTR